MNQASHRSDTDPDPDLSHLEWEMDWLVYDLYGPAEEEVAAIGD